MKLLFASDSFKGSLSSSATIDLLAQASKMVWPDVEYQGIVIADGGEGTLDAIEKCCPKECRRIVTTVHNPLMEPIEASYLALGQHKAVIEMAQSSGLTLIEPTQRNALNTTSYGTGELIRHALMQGFNELTIAIGGSATNDAAMGCLRALGAKFLDGSGCELEGRGSDLCQLCSIDLSHLLPQLQNASIEVMCDVKNHLLGSNGATYTFGPQKGADADALAKLETGMGIFRKVVMSLTGVDPDSLAGGGAAGGMGASLQIFLNAHMKMGIDTLLDLVDFESRLKQVDLVVTGEGCCDAQSSFGKVMMGVGRRCQKHNVPAVGLCGSLKEGYEEIYHHGISELNSIIPAPMTLDEAMENAHDLYLNAAKRMFQLIRLGMEIR